MVLSRYASGRRAKANPPMTRRYIPPDIQLKFATRAKSRIYHVPGGDHPSMIAHPEVTVAAIRDAANAVSHQQTTMEQRRLGNRAIPRRTHR